MSLISELENLPIWLSKAFQSRGFEELTSIQEAVLTPELAGCDLRIQSATGSGKTVAVGMALGESVEAATKNQPAYNARAKGASPAVLVIAPTRELADQLHKEFIWMYDSVKPGVGFIRGGGSYTEEIRKLKTQPQIVVGTPGRMVDHISRGTLNLDNIISVVLDEADHLLDLGFRDELDQILGACPVERRTILLSATFNKAVTKLADAHQKDAKWVKGTEGESPAEIEHVVHLIHRRSIQGALVNILLTAGKGRCLVFVERRHQSAEIAEELVKRGFSAAALHGEMAQNERTRTMNGFRNGHIQILVATDVAARGIDVQDIQYVIHAHTPRDSDTLIHRSGRTGRAGQKGTSIQLVVPQEANRLRRTFLQAGITPIWRDVPSAEDVRKLSDERLFVALSEDLKESPDKRALTLATRLLEEMPAEELIAQLVSHVRKDFATEPVFVEALDHTRPNPKSRGDRAERGERGGRDSRRGRERDRGRTRGGNEDRPWAASSRSGDDHQGSNRNDNFETFEVTTGEEFGANAHRLMAMACRRGDVGRQDIGAIKLGGKTSLIEVSTRVAEAFAAASSKRDARDRDVHFNPISYKPKSDRKPEYKTDRKPSYKSDRKPEYKTDRKPEYKSDRKPEYKSESKHSGEDDIWRTDDNRGENRGERSERKGGRNHRGTSDANPKGRWRKQEGQVETRGGNDSEGKERVTNSWRTRGGRSQDTRGGGFAPPRRREKGSVAPRRSR